MRVDKIKNKSYLYMFVIAVAIFLIVFASDKIAFVLNVFKPLFSAVVIAYLVDGIVRFFNLKLKLNRILSIVISIVLIVGIGALCSYYAIPFLVNMVMDLVDYVSTLLADHNTGFYTVMQSIAGFLNVDFDTIYNFDISKIDDGILEALNTFIQKFYSIVISKITSIGSSIVSIVTSVILAIYMLIEKEDLLNRARRLLRAITPAKYEDYILNSFTMANTVFKNFIIGKFIDSLIIGILMYILFKIFGIEYAAVFSLMCGIGNMIPYVGPIFSSIPVVVILFIINPWHALIALIIILVVQQLDSNVIGPKVLSDNIGVSAFWILFAVTVCGIAFGFIGMVVGVPLVVVVKNLVEDFVNFRLSLRENTEPDEETAAPKTEETEIAEVVTEDAQEQ